jgi:iron complex transport system substrate-binding protein
MDVDHLTGGVLDLSLPLHRELGPGLMESVYETALAGKVLQAGYAVERQKQIDIGFDGLSFPAASTIFWWTTALSWKSNLLSGLTPLIRSSC